MYIFIFYFIFSDIQYTAKSEISILGEGIGYIEEDDMAIIFFVTVKNICKDDLELSVNMIQCCESISSDDLDCSSMMLVGGDMGTLPSGYIKNLTLIYPNLYVFNRRGVCSVAITYRNEFKKKEITTDIHFDTTKSCVEKQPTEKCPTVDLDSKSNCNPVDCLIKYSGTISYFDPECNRCQKVTICNSNTGSNDSPDRAYSPYSNECIDLTGTISKKDLEEMETDQNGETQTSVMNAICHYGKVTDSGECLCNDGWTTATNEEEMYEPGVAQHHLCNIQVGDWNCVNKAKIRITTILITVFAVTVISKLLLLMCIMTWCYKHFRKPEKTCARELDPEDESIILCEDLQEFEKCLCGQEEEIQQPPQSKKKKTLNSETVNVSYYPSSPSAFSSIKGSSGSSKQSMKTDPTIDLENTSSSAGISFPEGNSTDDSDDSDDSDDDAEETCNDCNDVAYGVYCGIDELEGEEEVEEEVEEEEDEDVENPNDNVSQE